MVGGDDDERLIGMLLHKIIGDAYGIVHIDDLGEDGAGIVGMCCPVNLSTFHHKKESLWTLGIEEVDGSTRDFLKRHIPRLTVDSVRECAAVDL